MTSLIAVFDDAIREYDRVPKYVADIEDKKVLQNYVMIRRMGDDCEKISKQLAKTHPQLTLRSVFTPIIEASKESDGVDLDTFDEQMMAAIQSRPRELKNLGFSDDVVEYINTWVGRVILMYAYTEAYEKMNYSEWLTEYVTLCFGKE